MGTLGQLDINFATTREWPENRPDLVFGVGLPVPDGASYTPEQRLGALEQDMAAVKKAVSTLENESGLSRERYHNDSGIVQRLVMQAEEFTKAINRIEVSMASMAAAFQNQGDTLNLHIENCGRLTEKADTNRRQFRKEMRGYFITILLFAVGWYLSQKFHVSIGPGP